MGLTKLANIKNREKHELKNNQVNQKIIMGTKKENNNKTSGGYLNILTK